MRAAMGWLRASRNSNPIRRPVSICKSLWPSAHWWALSKKVKEKTLAEIHQSAQENILPKFIPFVCLIRLRPESQFPNSNVAMKDNCYEYECESLDFSR